MSSSQRLRQARRRFRPTSGSAREGHRRCVATDLRCRRAGRHSATAPRWYRARRTSVATSRYARDPRHSRGLTCRAYRGAASSTCRKRRATGPATGWSSRTRHRQEDRPLEAPHALHGRAAPRLSASLPRTARCEFESGRAPRDSRQQTGDLGGLEVWSASKVLPESSSPPFPVSTAATRASLPAGLKSHPAQLPTN